MEGSMGFWGVKDPRPSNTVLQGVVARAAAILSRALLWAQRAFGTEQDAGRGPTVRRTLRRRLEVQHGFGCKDHKC